MGRGEKVSKTVIVDGRKHALPRDKWARKSEQDRHGRWWKSTHSLETRRREKVSKTNMGDGEEHARARDKKARKSEKKNMGNRGKARTS
jgi:hypothetical protein